LLTNHLKKRLHESYEAILDFSKIYDEEIDEVQVISRIEDSIEFTNVENMRGTFLGEFSYQGLRYVFLDINGWVAFYIANLTSAGRLFFIDKLSAYIAEPNTAEKVKKAWGNIITGLKKNIED
jgi:hypothetical protein